MSTVAPSFDSERSPMHWAGDYTSQVTFTVIGIFVSFAAVGLITFCWKSHPLVTKHIILADEIPDSKKRIEQYYSEPRALIIKGYKKFRDQLWGIESSEGIRVVLPISYLDELKSHPSLSFEKFISNYAMIQYTGVGGLSDQAVHKFKSKFNPTIGAYIPILQSIVQTQLTQTLGHYDDWNEVSIHEKVKEIVGVLSARVFMSSEASRDPAWLHLAPAYVDTCIEYLQVIKAWPEFMRPLVHFFVSQRRTIVEQWNQAEVFLGQSIERTKAQGGSFDSPPSLMDHLISEGNVTVQDMIHMQMAIVVAGIHTTSNSLTQMIYDLAAYNDGIPELREEVFRIYNENGGVLDKKAVSRLEKMDSWMKESQRLAAPDLSVFQRLATQSFDFKDGTHIPKGTKMEVPLAAIHNDKSLYENPDHFDGLRFYKLRQNEAQASKHQYISTGKNDLAWGYGRHACPGRFIADVEIKLCLAEFLLRHDIKNPAGQPRHKNIEFESNVSLPTEIPGKKKNKDINAKFQLMPDPTKTVMLKTIQAMGP